ncbi:MAG: 3-hydroxylacyl-ACP dehydratase [Treponema sp.]|nr:3-hydroxylacyl-ACP dehydratase [Treponema sp.]
MQFELPVEKDELLTMVPHKGKMFLLNRVVQYDVEKLTITLQLDVKPDNIFYDEELGGIPSWCTFEIMAQGVAALSFIKKTVRGESEKCNPGVVLSISHFKTRVSSFATGTTIRIKISEDVSSGDISKFSCAIFGQDNTSQDDADVTTFITVMESKDLEQRLGQG